MMNRLAAGKMVVFLLLASFFLLGANECDFEDRKAVRGFLDEWANVQDKNPVNPDGSFNPGGFVNALTGKPSDDEAGGALDPDEKLKNIARADRLVDEGLVAQDLRKVDEAIGLRPKDLGYRNARGIVLLIQGKEDEAVKEFSRAYGPAGPLFGPNVMRVFFRDRMRRIDEQLSIQGVTGLQGKPDVIANLQKYYCEAAKIYWKGTGDRSYGDKYRCDIPK